MKLITIKNCTIGSGMPKICLPIVGTTEENMIPSIAFMFSS